MQYYSKVIIILIALSVAASLQAAPSISIDLDPLTPGIQDALSVNQGDSFSLDIIYLNDGSFFDTTFLDVAFNDSGSIITQSGSPTAGSLAGTSPLTLDAVSFAPITTGANMNTLAPTPIPGFVDSTGGMGLTSLVGPFNIVTPDIDILSLSFIASQVGQSLIEIFGSPLGSPFLSFSGAEVAADIQGAIVTVQANETAAVPIPGMGPLIYSLFALFGLRRSIRNRKKLIR